MAGFSQAARSAVLLAQDEAMALDDSCIDIEHILVGIIKADPAGNAARALAALGVSFDRPPQVPGNLCTQGPASREHLPFSSRARKCVELALLEAAKLGHDEICPEHILLGLIRGDEDGVAEVLAPYGVHPRQLQLGVLRLASGE